MTRIALALVLAAPFCAVADTIFFKDGRTLDGVTSQPNPNAVAITMGDSRLVFPAEDIDRIEKNDKTSGGYDIAKVSPMAVQHMQSMEEKYGVNQEQREALLQVVHGLRSDDPNEQSAAMTQLAAMNGQMDVVKFLGAAVGDFNKRLAPKVMEALVTLDPERAKPTLRERTQDMTSENRAAAVELLARAGDVESIELVARGMKDMENNVKIAAANGLARFGDKRATPALLEGLKSNDQKVVNASKVALERIWSEGDTPVTFEKPEEWQTYWNGRQGEVEKPIAIASLEPLVVPDPNQPEGYDYAE